MNGPVRLPQALALAACGLALVLLLWPAADAETGAVLAAAAVVTLAIGLWATGVLPEYYTALLFFLSAAVLTAAPAAVVFSGFHSGAVWVVFGGLVVALAVQTTGLGARLARMLVGWFRESYLGVLFGLTAVTLVLDFLVPSASARIVILMPITLALAEALGFAEGSRGRAGMALAVGAATIYPAFAILPSAVPNLGLIGAAESIHGISLRYGEYILIHFPVAGLFGVLVAPLLLWAMFREAPARSMRAAEVTPFTPDERRLLAILLTALALWMTDALHGLSPAWVALGAALACLAPGAGVLRTDALVRQINFGPWFFVAGVIGMGALVAQSGLGDRIGAVLLGALDLAPGEDARNFAAIVAIGMGVGLVSTMPGQPGIMTALAGPIAEATGWPLTTVLMAQVPSWSLALAPYQLPPIVLTIGLAGLTVGPVIRFLITYTALSWLVSLPLQYLWWRALGLIGGG